MPERQMGIRLDDIEQKHKDRYEMARQFCRDAVVLDASCGVGYGSVMLAERAKFVFGMDRSVEAIAYANLHYKKQNVIYYIKDLDIDYLGCDYDVIVSMETIEHLIKPVQSTIQDFASILKKGGNLIISHPENEETGNQFHLHMKIKGDDVKKYIEKAGLVIEHETMQPGNSRYDYHLYVLKKV